MKKEKGAILWNTVYITSRLYSRSSATADAVIVSRNAHLI